MENLFLDAIETDKFLAIEEIKRNKQFTKRLIEDLNEIFQTNYQIDDECEGVVIRMKTSPSNNWYNCAMFIVSKQGISFQTDCLAYYESEKFKSLGVEYEKYKDSGTTADNSFSNNSFGWVKFKIPINRNGENLKEILRDIVSIMEQKRFNKRF